MGDYKNVSSKWKFGLLGLPDGAINIGVGGKLWANFKRDGDTGTYNITLKFGTDSYISNPEYNNDRFFFECLDPMLQPPDLLFPIEMTGLGLVRIDSKSGGNMEGTYFGQCGWKRFVQNGVTKTGIVIGTCETDYRKSGKAAWVTWIYPSEGLYAKDTTIKVTIESEIKPLTPLAKVQYALARSEPYQDNE